MRTRITGSLVLTLAAALTVGCNSHSDKAGNQAMDSNKPMGSNKSMDSSKPMDAGKAAAAKSCTLQSGGKDVLSVTPPADATCTPEDGHVTLKGHGNQVDIWLIADATSVTDGIAKVPEQIKKEFVGFKAKSTSDLTVAGNPAKRMMGAGNEADDNDPGTADVVVFKAGDHVFVSCVHGEHIPADAPAWMTTVLQTAKAP